MMAGEIGRQMTERMTTPRSFHQYPAIVRKVKNLVNPEQEWCVQWQTHIMRAPAFWYYNTEAEARAAATWLS